MNEHTFETLELGALLELLATHVQTPLGRSNVLGLRPNANLAEIDRALDLTMECIQLLESGEKFGLAGIENPEPSMARLNVEGTALEPRQVLELERLVSTGVELRGWFRRSPEREQYPQLARLTSRIPDLRRLLEEIRGKVLPSGEIDDSASPQLRAIRREMLIRRSRIYRSLEGILHQQSRAVQEEIVTFRNGRFVIPIRTDSRVQVPGVVHGLSSSGQTTYIEPLTVIEQNNDLVRLHEQQEIEITRILHAITDAFRSNREAIRIIAETVGEVDLSQAKARLSVQFDCVRPRLSSSRRLCLRDARHILLEQALQPSGRHAVPISFELDEAHQILVISGPNAGGKTVVLKTAGLITLMAQMGLAVPAREALLPVFDQVFADIGDQQSISANLSTFTAHLRNIAAMAREIRPPVLLLIDEVGTGTDPEEGAALAVAVVNYFRCARATLLSTTHYNLLKMWASQTEGVLNASVEFDEQTLQPTYRLMVGIAGSSSGLEIARRMAVPESMLDHAASLVDPDHTLAGTYLKKLKLLADDQTAALATMQEERAFLARERAQLEEQFARREAARRSEFDAALERGMRDFLQMSEQLIHGLKERVSAEKLKKAAQNRTSQLRRAGREIQSKIEQEISLSPQGGSLSKVEQSQPALHAERVNTEPIEGDRVWIRPLSQPGTVESVHEEIYTVSVGSLKFRAGRSDLQRLEPAPSQQSGNTAAKAPPEPSLDQPFSPEINLIGMSADDAVERADKFLDEAFLAGADSIRIIHGHGKGILRRAIAELLTGHPQVERFQPAQPNQGGGGVTLVYIRQ